MEIIKRYREGNASQEEKKLVQVEIEKNKAINDLLADEFEKDFDFAYDPGNNDERTEESIDEIGETIKKAVNRRFRKMLIMSVLSVVLIFALLQLIVSPVMDKMYYDPGNKTYGQYKEDISYDLAAFTELNVPGYSSSTVYVDDKGYGRYDLIIRRRNLFQGDYKRIGISQKRDRIEGFFDYKFGYDMFLNRPGGDEEEKSVFDYKIPMKELKEMDQKNYVSAFVVFNENKTLVDYWEIRQEYDLEFKWLAVDTGVDIEASYRSYIGFNPDTSDGMSTTDEFDREKYPFFDLREMFEVKPEEIHGKPYPEKMAYYYEEHFKTLLKYLIDQDEFTSMYDLNPNRHGHYEEAYTYVEENGVSLYAILIFGDAGDIVDFVEKEDVYSVNINDVKVSRY